MLVLVVVQTDGVRRRGRGCAGSAGAGGVGGAGRSFDGLGSFGGFGGFGGGAGAGGGPRQHAARGVVDGIRTAALAADEVRSDPIAFAGLQYNAGAFQNHNGVVKLYQLPIIPPSCISPS